MRSMMRSLLLGSCAVLCALAGGCLMCNSIACNGGLEVTASMSDGGALADGQYDVHLTIEGDTVDFSCAIADGNLPSGGCDPAEGAGWAIMFYVAEEVSGFKIRISDQDAGGGSDSVRGPDSVSVSIALDGTTIGVADYAPEYTRDEDFYGDEECGYCDSLAQETIALNRP